MEAIERALPIVKEVVIGGEVIKVSKLPLGQYAKLLLALKKLPTSALKDVQGINTDDNEQAIMFLLGVIAESWEQVVDIIAIGSGMDKTRLMNDPEIGLDGGVALFLAIYEVNNLSKVIQTVKNAIARGEK